jgi:hypothetical protein
VLSPRHHRECAREASNRSVLQGKQMRLLHSIVVVLTQYEKAALACLGASSTTLLVVLCLEYASDQIDRNRQDNRLVIFGGHLNQAL